ncbi:5' exonuclease Apollo [Aulostomus maculatus]
MSVNGKVIPHTPLAVDFWQVRKCPQTRLFFLSHMHSDHTVGLTSTWSNRPIYCSPVTASLLRLKLQIKEKWIHPLEVGDPYLLPLDDIGKEGLTVTLMDANHCPGAVMFLFEGYFGSILYTGDFRYSPSMLRELCLRTNATIDILYLDNTNCDPNRSLPTRQQATQQIKEIIRSHPNYSVVIGLYTLGKESLLVELAMEFKTWIEVSFARMETLRVLELPDVFTTDRGAGRIRAVDQSEISPATLRQWNDEQLTLVILPTSRPLVSFHPKLHVVPYSDHSSYQELVDFVSVLKPASVIPIVGKCVPGSLSALLPNTKRHEFLVPESVQHYMTRQPENRLSSSAFTSLCRRHVRPLVPRGVIFESPVSSARKGSEEAWEVECLEQEASEEEMDTESSDRESDCIFIDLTETHTPKKNTTRPLDPWTLNIVHTVPEEVFMSQPVPFSQLSQSNYAPVEILRNSSVCLRPIRTATTPLETSAETMTKQYTRRGNLHSSPTSSDGDGLSQCSVQRRDQDPGVMPSNMPQHNGYGGDDNATVVQTSPDGVSCSSSSNLSEMSHVYLEKIEDSILECLPFTEEDFRICGLLDKSILGAFPICPSCNVRDDEFSDR